MRFTAKFHGEKFFVTIGKMIYATPLLLVVILIESSDLIFALDSIPAIFGITQDPFIIFTSNIFAIMGLRALYFVLADMEKRFYLLKYAVALLLIFIGGKMLMAFWIVIPISVTLSIVFAVLSTSVILSLRIQRR